MNVEAVVAPPPPAVAPAGGDFIAPPAASGAAPTPFLNRTAYICATIHGATWFPLDPQDGLPPIEHFEPLIAEHAQSDFDMGKVTYFIAQSELCPTTGRVHIQAYAEASTRRTFDAWRKLRFLSDGSPWITAARGTGAQNQAYCSKPDSFHGWSLELGQFRNVGAGGRSDLLVVKRKLVAGTPDLDIWMDDDNFGTMVRYHKAFDRFRSLLNTRVGAGNRTQRIVIVYWGPTGTGKSHSCMERFPDFYPVPDAKGSGLYFDSYNGQQAMLFDEMNGDRMKHSLLLNLCGNAPVLLPVSGGFTPLLATTTHVLFTSDKHPGHWYPGLYEKYPLLWPMFERRIMEVHHLTVRFVNDDIIIRHWPAPPPEPPAPIDNRILFHP